MATFIRTGELTELTGLGFYEVERRLRAAGIHPAADGHYDRAKALAVLQSQPKQRTGGTLQGVSPGYAMGTTADADGGTPEATPLATLAAAAGRRARVARAILAGAGVEPIIGDGEQYPTIAARIALNLPLPTIRVTTASVQFSE